MYPNSHDCLSFLTQGDVLCMPLKFEVIHVSVFDSEVLLALDVMSDWINEYIDNSCEAATLLADVAHHGPFYAACQALFYLLTFSHKTILQQPNGMYNIHIIV